MEYTTEGLKKENLYPKVSRGASFSEKYIKINEVLKGLASDNKMTFYELDNIWWHVTEEPAPPPEEEAQETEELSTGFGLEPHLRRFLIDNWENTPLGKKYEILTEDGEIIGEEYPTKEAGNIDILAKDKKSKEWVVIELKKGQSSDAVVGQILRYIGWIERNKIEKDEGVKGIIIVKEIDKKHLRDTKKDNSVLVDDAYGKGIVKGYWKIIGPLAFFFGLVFLLVNVTYGIFVLALSIALIYFSYKNGIKV